MAACPVASGDPVSTRACAIVASSTALLASARSISASLVWSSRIIRVAAVCGVSGMFIPLPDSARRRACSRQVSKAVRLEQFRQSLGDGNQRQKHQCDKSREAKNRQYSPENAKTVIKCLQA